MPSKVRLQTNTKLETKELNGSLSRPGAPQRRAHWRKKDKQASTGGGSQKPEAAAWISTATAEQMLASGSRPGVVPAGIATSRGTAVEKKHIRCGVPKRLASYPDLPRDSSF